MMIQQQLPPPKKPLEHMRFPPFQVTLHTIANGEDVLQKGLRNSKESGIMFGIILKGKGFFYGLCIKLSPAF